MIILEPCMHADTISSLGSARLDLLGGVLIELGEVLLEHAGHFLEGLVEFHLASPAVRGVEDLGVYALDGLGVLQVEDGQSVVLSIGQFSAVDRVDDISSVVDRNSLS